MSLITTKSDSPDLWLVRDHLFRLRGPFPRADIIRMIRAGELVPEDEVCRSNQYWFFLYEIEEVKSQLGSEAIVHLPPSQLEEPTRTLVHDSSEPEPEMETYDQTSQISITTSSHGVATGVVNEAVVGEMKQDARTLRRAVHRTHPTGRALERPPLWRLLTLLFLLGASVLIAAILEHLSR